MMMMKMQRMKMMMMEKVRKVRRKARRWMRRGETPLLLTNQKRETPRGQINSVLLKEQLKP